MKFDKVTRVEVIEGTKRAYVTWLAKNVQVQTQDNGRTLKIFLDQINEVEP